jgi:hypothetical protein
VPVPVTVTVTVTVTVPEGPRARYFSECRPITLPSLS